MKDPIKDLIQDSGLEPSEGFSEATMDRLEHRLLARMQWKLHTLIAAVVGFIALVMWNLLSSGFQVKAFGNVIGVPRVLTMVVLSLGTCFVVGHLLLLRRVGQLEKG